MLAIIVDMADQQSGERQGAGVGRPNDRRTFLKAAGGASVIGLTGLAGCTGSLGGSSQPSRDYFKLGVVTSLSGDLRYGGYVTRRGYDLWKQEINKQGGIEVDGEKYNVQLVYADAKSQPSTGADAASKMISNEKVDAVLGP